jgi:hypothetical protein
MSKLRTWHVRLYVALLSFNYISGFACMWLSGGDVLGALFHVESLVPIIVGGALQSVAIWFIIGKTIEYLNTYLSISEGETSELTIAFSSI